MKSTIKINAVSPGIVDTPWLNFLEPEIKSETFAGYSTGILLGRVAQPDDMLV